MANTVPNSARVVIVGGGVMGVGLAYHLGHEGWGDSTAVSYTHLTLPTIYSV